MKFKFEPGYIPYLEVDSMEGKLMPLYILASQAFLNGVNYVAWFS